MSSKYKSEFLANMSHELRTPLNSLLILSNLLAANEDENLSDKQIEFAQHDPPGGLRPAHADQRHPRPVEGRGRQDGRAPLARGDSQVQGYVERSFRPLAAQKELGFEISVAEDAPKSIETDEQRLQQVLKNLLSNAFKFTEQGGVTLRIERAPKDIAFASEILTRADGVVAFSVSDSGIGIAEDKLRLIFEAFQQADGTTVAQVRRHRPRPVDLARDRAPARRRDQGGVDRRARARRSRSTCRRASSRSTSSATARRAEPGARAGPTRRGRAARGPGPALVPAGTNGDRVGAESQAAAATDEALALPPGLEDDRGSLLPGDRVFLLIEDDEELARTRSSSATSAASRA